MGQHCNAFIRPVLKNEFVLSLFFHMFKPLEEPALVFLLHAASAELGWDADAPPKCWGFFRVILCKPCARCCVCALCLSPSRSSPFPGEGAPPCEAPLCPDQPQNPSCGTSSSRGGSGVAPSPLMCSGLCKGATRSYEQHLSCTPWGIRAVKAEWQTSFGR